jgi:hypothetical protein
MGQAQQFVSFFEEDRGKSTNISKAASDTKLTRFVQVRWADRQRQFRLNPHVKHKVATGATRNLMIHTALDKGLTEARIREDMEHIHNLVIIDVSYHGADALVCTNSIHNALYARTCMMSRAEYKGCKIVFSADECDVPLPARLSLSTNAVPRTITRTIPNSNRFDMLDLPGTDSDSDEENRAPVQADTVRDTDEDVDTGPTSQGVSLGFLNMNDTVYGT